MEETMDRFQLREIYNKHPPLDYPYHVPAVARWSGHYEPTRNHTSIAASTNNQTRADDLIPEENDVVQKALKRLPPKEAYDRIFRIRRAFQVRPHTELQPQKNVKLT